MNENVVDSSLIPYHHRLTEISTDQTSIRKAMAQDDCVVSPELPAELWHRILRASSNFDRNDLKNFSLVCRVLTDVSQAYLFEELSANADVGLVYRNPLFDGQHEVRPLRRLGTKCWPAQEWMWKEWEKNLRSAITSERRLTLVGTHKFLAEQPRKLKIRGYRQDAYPVNPFKPPHVGQALSRAVFNAFHRFQQVLPVQLSAFNNLRRLELFKYPVDHELLRTVESHPSLTEIRFEFCWFPESTFPLTTITTLSYGHFPGSHIQPSYFAQPQYRHIPDHHVASAFNLISPLHIQHLGIEFGSEYGDEAVFE